MDKKTLAVLEFPKIVDQLAACCAFSASVELARTLQPVTNIETVLRRQAETSQASHLLATTEATVGGSHDVRATADLARHGGVLEPQELLDIKSTLVAARLLKRLIEKQAGVCPLLAETAKALPESPGLVDSISRTISDEGEVLDSASPRLASLRREVRLAHERLTNRLQRYLTDVNFAPMLQDNLITQREGRYVLPLRAEFKGRVKSIVHDQSSTGATLFIEPLAVVELNNAYREVQLAERDEVRRVLTEISMMVGSLAEEITWGVEALAELDLAFAKAKYAEKLHAAEPIVYPNQDKPQSTEQTRPVSQTMRLLNARHPLLDPETVVPITVELSPETRAVVITGPNTGGKTVSLKTVGLMVLMAQAGMHIPAQSGSSLPLFEAAFADIGDEQSIEQSLSTFSGHIKNIIRILQAANDRSLVILDELGAGTDPQEGSALARAILTHLLERGIATFVATHYPELKAYAQSTPGAVNASLEFDLRTLRPTFQLTIGLPGRSNALAIAQRLGLPESLLATAREFVPADELHTDKLLEDLHRQLKEARKERKRAEKARIEVHRLRRELSDRLEKIDNERQAILEKAQIQAETQIEDLQSEIQSLKRQLLRAGQPLEKAKAVKEKADALERKTRKLASKQEKEVKQQLVIGQKVLLKKLGLQGRLIALDGNEAEVLAGTLRVRVKPGDLQIGGDSEPDLRPEKAEEESGRTSLPSVDSPGMEISLRGQTADEALEALERYLDQAYLAGMPFVRIIHGKGTGKLRQVIREALKNHPYVSSFEEGGDKEGGAGVTVAKIVD